VSVPDLIIKLSASFGDKDRAEALKVLTGRGPLVLDDLDKIKPSAHVLSHLFTAIDARYQSGAPLFVTTNMVPSELVDFFAGDRGDADERRVAAEAIVSRLLEHCVLHRIEGPDRRRAAP
jgi:DNA replication protein DnaC